MNKAQLIDAIAQQADISKLKAGETLDAFVVAVTKALKDGDTVTLVGFGSFSTAQRAARIGRNPKTGKEIKIEATTTPKFKAGKALREVVSGKVKIVAAKKPVVKAVAATKSVAKKPVAKKK